VPTLCGATGGRERVLRIVFVREREREREQSLRDIRAHDGGLVRHVSCEFLSFAVYQERYARGGDCRR
jgi:hypothetical protein